MHHVTGVRETAASCRSQLSRHTPNTMTSRTGLAAHYQWSLGHQSLFVDIDEGLPIKHPEDASACSDACSEGREVGSCLAKREATNDVCKNDSHHDSRSVAVLVRARVAVWVIPSQFAAIQERSAIPVQSHECSKVEIQLNTEANVNVCASEVRLWQLISDTTAQHLQFKLLMGNSPSAPTVSCMCAHCMCMGKY
jgi:hypothetical protein